MSARLRPRPHDLSAQRATRRDDLARLSRSAQPLLLPTPLPLIPRIVRAIKRRVGG